MPIEVVLPKVDMDMESGVIAEWQVAEGDLVRAGRHAVRHGDRQVDDGGRGARHRRHPRPGAGRRAADRRGNARRVDRRRRRGAGADAAPRAGARSPTASGATRPLAAAHARTPRRVATAADATTTRPTPRAPLDDFVATWSATSCAQRRSHARSAAHGVDLRASTAGAARPRAGGRRRGRAEDARRRSAAHARRRADATRRRCAACRSPRPAASSPSGSRRACRRAPFLPHRPRRDDGAAGGARRGAAGRSSPPAARAPGVTVALAWLVARVLVRHPLLNASADADAARSTRTCTSASRWTATASSSCRCCATPTRARSPSSRAISRRSRRGAGPHDPAGRDARRHVHDLEPRHPRRRRVHRHHQSAAERDPRGRAHGGHAGGPRRGRSCCGRWRRCRSRRTTASSTV